MSEIPRTVVGNNATHRKKLYCPLMSILRAPSDNPCRDCGHQDECKKYFDAYFDTADIEGESGRAIKSQWREAQSKWYEADLVAGLVKEVE